MVPLHDSGPAQGTFVMQIEGRDNDQPGTINSQLSYRIMSQEPEGIGEMFQIDEKTGKLYVKESTLDRETIDFYRLVIQGVDLGGAAGGLKGSGTVEIRVLDINDNIPTLEQSEYTGSVDENIHDVVVLRIQALDLDLEHTDNWRAVFVILKGNEDNLFSIETDENSNEGILKLIKPVDFEEVQNLELSLLIRNVAPFIKGDAVVMDVGVKVGEGEPLAPEAGPDGGASAEVGLHIEGHAGVQGPGVDLSAGLHPEANIDLDINAGGVEPESEPKGKRYSIMIAVNNVPEDPAFVPQFKEVPVTEDPYDQPEDGIIAVLAAVDPDTGKPAENVRYAKASDPDNWFTIDEDTAEIKLNKKPDRESPFVVNGTYIAKIVAVSKEDQSVTATGTIGIKVTDSNDHCPTLTSTHSSLCADKKTVYVTALDEDANPNAAPFTFTIDPEGSQGSWDIEVINGTTAALHSRENLWPGIYKLQVMVSDAQGLSCPVDEVFTLHVCTCVDSDMCHFRPDRRVTSSSELSAAAIGLLLLALGLLLLLPLLLLFCQCGGANTIFPDQFTDLPFEAKQHLISYHTEGNGKDEEVPLKSIPVMTTEMGSAANFKTVPSKIIETYETSTFHKESMESKFQETQEIFNSVLGFSDQSLLQGNILSRTQVLGTTTTLFEDIALSDAFLKDYYTQRAQWAMPVKDGLLEFHFDGQGSSAGSVSSCSLLDSQDDLQFLDDIGMKFKTLAEICSPPEKPLPFTTTLSVETLTRRDQTVQPQLESVVETMQIDGRKETLISMSLISKSSVNNLSTSPTSMKLPHTKIATIKHSCNDSQMAALLPQSQTVLLQQQPVYYTTSTVLHPVQYVVQPPIQNMVLLADEAPRANFPGVFVVHDSKNPPGPVKGSACGIVIKGSEHSKNLESRASPTSPTLVLPVSPGMAQSSGSVKGWKIVVPNPDGKPNFVGSLVANKSSGVAQKDPVPSWGTLHICAIPVKKAAPPQESKDQQPE
ncbi:Desmoglein-2 Cadherin family member 5 HDGC [Takifugu flavidus]|uniref:Desmoglein-2 Cadherin family member 5 HDGC n=1 Tax=Takifugu flavidus TaxID=433684 RepID=A0A5C6MQU6_9TELE|nr:Desmoglein-2 Cadherin family member 5 HDGC [Takifugu flavidus]